jgi:hypothetical protein
MANIFTWVQMIISVISMIIMLVERPGEGQQKKDEAIDAFIKAVASLPVPSWVKLIFTNREIIGILIDLAVWRANKSTVFKKEEIPSIMSNESENGQCPKDRMIYTENGVTNQPDSNIINTAEATN